MDDHIAQVRTFNRFYTRFVGALDRGHLDSDFSLAEVRVLYELANNRQLLAKNIIAELGLDPGYLSRMLKRFRSSGLVKQERSRADGRASALSLTPAGEQLFAELDHKAATQVAQAIGALSDAERDRLTSAMAVVRRLLDRGSGARDDAQVELRQPQAGDYGWAVERHGLLYALEYGWGPAFEGLVAELFGSFARSHDRTRERCWIAELGGRRAGCIFVFQREREVAQLRCLLVEPWARGHGIGKALVDACVGFARGAGYKRMMLWTNKGLDSARKIYEAVGFQLVEEQRHTDFGPELVGQNWELELGQEFGVEDDTPVLKIGDSSPERD